MAQSAAQNRAPQLHGLTGLRFFAALWVVLYHSWPYLTDTMPGLVHRGILGVELFFVLSGFVLAHVYFDPFRAGQFSYGSFLWARLARIYPVHLILTLGLVVLVVLAQVLGLPLGGNVVAWSSLPAHLTLTQSWGLGMEGGWNYPAWSISAEWFAYLAFPLCAVVFASVRARPLLAVALSALFLLAVFLGFEKLSGNELTKATLAWGPVRILPSFALGNALWLAYRARLSLFERHPQAMVLGFSLLSLGLIYFGAHDAVCTLAFGGLILSLAHLNSRRHVLNHPVLITLGEASFALYMVNIVWTLVFVHGLKKLMPELGEHLPLWAWWALVLGNIPAALIVHFVIERPAQTWLRAKYDERVVPWRTRLRLEPAIRPGFQG